MERPKRKRLTKSLDVNLFHDFHQEDELLPNACEESNLEESTVNNASCGYEAVWNLEESSDEESMITGNRDDDDVEYGLLMNEEENSVSPVELGKENSTEEDYRLTAYVNFVLSEGLSEKTLSRLDHLMAVLYGEMPPFTKTDVMKAINNIESNVINRTFYYCIKCASVKRDKYSICEKCESFSTKLPETVTFVLCDVDYQFERLFMAKGEEILTAHAMIHAKKENFHIHDIRRFPGYQKMMESEQEFRKGIVHVPCTVSSDGARFKRVSRREVTPMLVRVEGVNMGSKKGGGTMIVCSLGFSDGGIKTNLIDEFVNKSLHLMSHKEFKIVLNNRTFLFKPVVMSYLADMKEQLALSGLPNWHSINGCSKCYTTGTKKSNGKVSFESYKNAPLRSDDSLRVDTATGSNGMPGERVPAIFCFISPTKISVDPFHVRGMGVCKFSIEELHKPTRWTKAKLKRGIFEKLAKSVEEVQMYTYDPVRLISPRKLGKATGRELDKISQYMAALVGWNHGCESPEMSIFYLGFYHCLTFLGSFLGDSASLTALLDKCYHLLSELEGSSVTIKWHVFFKHCQQHEEQFGILQTTEPFEREHKVFMTSVNFQTTNSEKVLVTRYIASQIYTQKIGHAIEALPSEPRENLRKSTKNQIAIIPQPCGNANFVRSVNITDYHRQLINSMMLNETDVVLLKRVYIETRSGSFVFSSPSYWKTKITTSSIVTFIDPQNGDIKFGDIEIIMSTNGSTCLILNEYHVEGLSEIITTYENLTNCNIAKAVLNNCRRFPKTFGRITGSHLTVVPLNCVLSPATIISHCSRNFVKMYR